MKNNLYNLKESHEIKDVDTGSRQVALYLSKFDNIDSDNDIIRKGAFKKSIKERGVSSRSNRKIAFLRHQDKMKWVDDSTMPSKGFFEVKELKLWEGSAVTFGSNDMCNVVGMKGQDKTDHIEKITNQLNICIKALSNGGGTDERLHEIEMKVKYLNSQLVLLATNEPVIDHSVIVKSEPEIVKAFDWNSVITNINF